MTQASFVKEYTQQSTLLQIDDKLKQLDITASGHVGDGNGNSTQPFQGRAGAYTKLPKLQLRKFYGKAHKWTKFWDSFKASVDANQSLSPVLKLEYLKTQCEGAAYQAIAGLELSDSNYEVAIDILKVRFGQRQVILNSHIDALMKINALHGIADVSEVRRFYDTVEIHCRGLQSLGVDPKAYGTVLMNLLLQKLPEEIQLIIGRKLSELHGDEDWELPKLLEILKVEIEAREKCSAGKTVPKRSGMSGHATAAALTAANTGKTNCTYCKGSHNTVECHVVTDVQERKKILRNTGHCFLCLRKCRTFGKRLRCLYKMFLLQRSSSCHSLP